MRVAFAQAAMAVGLAIGPAVLGGCAPRMTPEELAARLYGDVVPKERMDRLEIGMSLDEARRALAPARGAQGSPPSLTYRDGEGGSWLLLFYRPEDLPVGNSSRGLRFVIHLPAGQEKPRYLLPKSLRGNEDEPAGLGPGQPGGGRQD